MEESKQLTEKQKQFWSFPKEVQWTIIKQFLDMFGFAVSRKMSVLPSLSAIAIAMLIVATLNPEVIPITVFQVKILISILLFFIPYCLIIYILDVNEEAEKSLKYYEEYTGINVKEKIMSKQNRLVKFWRYVSGNSPIFIAIIYFVIVIFLWYLMWS